MYNFITRFYTIFIYTIFLYTFIQNILYNLYVYNNFYTEDQGPQTTLRKTRWGEYALPNPRFSAAVIQAVCACAGAGAEDNGAGEKAQMWT